ncbi:hypothetical protein SRABI27_04530 [Pedobacter sp. Bi27]|uniref:DUF4265 domain-containing protein n=1 Tax=unclassified Pedobacter TaxID=2628915 RepID=UPI001E19EC4C|nr:MULTISPECIES: DUF4265 domain-containing protein [unclassified Pedobacter]CAH0193035.1 hypothetical protein SRABI36_01800 [Pedobacter sp. Bi36]CAH0248710.1 hypothetical protein SRABI126_02894 [Pedobacter sp. Bi126]CAH0304876.1 hypothetical protein SRABI27_04530 [Pedobacter sp. Bi27]
MTEDKLVKVLFAFHSDALEEWTIETMWCETVDQEKGHYKLENIPFYAPFAYNDLVFAEYDEDEGMLTYRETIAYSGHSTIQVVLMDSANSTNEIITMLETLGVKIEKFKDGYFVIDIPPSLNYKPINNELKNLAEKEIIDYAESCLDDKHQFQIT